MLQDFTAVVARIADLTHDVREIELQLEQPDGIAFKAGQFVTFKVPKPGLPRPVSRAYSIASPPSERCRVLLLFNRVPDGPGSTYLFGLEHGERTHFRGPAGSFGVREPLGPDVLLVATGTGIAPLRSMLLMMLEQRTGPSIDLLWGLRSERDMYYARELAGLASAHARFSFTITLSQPGAGWTGTRGRVTRLVDGRVAAASSIEAYICGSRAMIRDVTAVLRTKGVSRVYAEQYYAD
jgi:CDP-4-dehydro-6-deoxyglucose reductase